MLNSTLVLFEKFAQGIHHVAPSSFTKAALFDFGGSFFVGSAHKIGVLAILERKIIGNANDFGTPINICEIVKGGITPYIAGFGAFSIRTIGRDYFEHPYIGGGIAGALKYAGKAYAAGSSAIDIGIKFAIGGFNNAAYEVNRDYTPEHMQYWSAPIIEGVEGLILGFIGGCRKDFDHCISSGLKHALFNGLLSAGVGMFLTEVGNHFYEPVLEFSTNVGDFIYINALEFAETVMAPTLTEEQYALAIQKIQNIDFSEEYIA